MNGKSLETAAVDRARRLRESQSADGLLRGYRLKTAYFCNEHRAALGLSALRGVLEGGLAPLTEPAAHYWPPAPTTDGGANRRSGCWDGR